MKVAFVHHFSLTLFAGGEKALLNMASQLRAMGHEVKVYALPIAKRSERYKQLHMILEEIGVDYHECFFHKVRDVDVAYYVYAPLIHRLIRTNAPKIAGLHSPMYAIKLQYEDVENLNAFSFLKHFGLPRTLSRYYFEFRPVELRDYDAVHVVNPAMKDLLNHYRIYFIPNGVDVDRFRPIDPSRKCEKFTVLFVGRREWAKGFDIFMKTAELLSSRNDVEFIATGPSVGNVKGLGFISEEELPRVYAESHVVLYPSRIDVQGLVILEALAAGTPVITTPIPAHTVFNLPLIYVSTAEEAAKRVLEIKEEWEKRFEEYAERCRLCRKSAEAFDIRVMLREFEKMLIEVARKR